MWRETMVFIGTGMQGVGAVYLLTAVVWIAADIARRLWP